MREGRVVPLFLDEGKLVVAAVNPNEGYLKDALAMATGYEIEFRIGTAAEIETAIEKLYGTGRSAMGEIVDTLGDDSDDSSDDVEHLKDMASEAPVIRLVNLIIQRSVESRASDIHIEPFEGRLKVRYRIDGVLQEVEAPPSHSTAAVISRIKIMAKLNIAERRVPQDGRITMRVQGKELDMRVSTVPTLFGESVVIRLLNKESVKFDFESLGFEGETLKRLKHVLDLPHGVVLVTGPTGSGKSTTLYTALHRLNTPERKIITVEDPVEYQLEGINQIQVKPQVGLDFANALRAIVRQDPDVIMVGEMRDTETVRIAVQSALTGHLVLSTLHTNDAAGGITRLMDMGVEDFLLTSTVNGIVAQRLVRRLCQHCRQQHAVIPEVEQELGLTRYVKPGEELRLYSANGCPQCGGTGYHGRLSLAEILLMTDNIRQLIMRHANATEINSAALADGMENMYQDGLRKAVAGLTTLEEVVRVCEED
jgi:general secretion pathway protein E